MARNKKVTGNEKLDDALQKFPEMNNKDALDVGLALQQIFRGQESILQKMEGTSKEAAEMREELRRMKSQMDKYDKAAEKFESDKSAFIENVLTKAEKLKAKGTKKDKLIAQGVLEAQEAVKNARASQAVDKLQFEQLIYNQPKVSVTSPGKLVSGIANGQPISQIEPEEVRIRHMRWVLPVGIPVEVPEAVASVVINRRKSEQETRERQLLLQKNMDNDELTRATMALNQKYGSPAALPGQGEI